MISSFIQCLWLEPARHSFPSMCTHGSCAPRRDLLEYTEWYPYRFCQDALQLVRNKHHIGRSWVTAIYQQLQLYSFLQMSLSECLCLALGEVGSIRGCILLMIPSTSALISFCRWAIWALPQLGGSTPAMPEIRLPLQGRDWPLFQDVRDGLGAELSLC